MSKLGATMDRKKFTPDNSGKKLRPGNEIQHLKPRNIQETKVWQDTIGAGQQMWSNYVNLLNISFRKMPRSEQCKLITRLSQIISMGVAALATSFFYQFLPLFVRVLALPAILVAAWLIGTKVVPAVIIRRVERHLNR